MTRTPLAFTGVILFVLATFAVQNQKTQSNPFTQPKGSIGATQVQPSAQVNVLTKPSPSVVPGNEYQEGIMQEHVTTLDSRINQLEQDMRSVLTWVNIQRGVYIALGAIGVSIGVFLLAFWRPLVQFVIKKSYDSKSSR